MNKVMVFNDLSLSIWTWHGSKPGSYFTYLFNIIDSTPKRPVRFWRWWQKPRKQAGHGGGIIDDHHSSWWCLMISSFRLTGFIATTSLFLLYNPCELLCRHHDGVFLPAPPHAHNRSASMWMDQRPCFDTFFGPLFLQNSYRIRRVPTYGYLIIEGS